MSEWILCSSCESEFQVIEASDNRLSISYCPYCGCSLEAFDEDEDFDDAEHIYDDEDDDE